VQRPRGSRHGNRTEAGSERLAQSGTPRLNPPQDPWETAHERTPVRLGVGSVHYRGSPECASHIHVGHQDRTLLVPHPFGLFSCRYGNDADCRHVVGGQLAADPLRPAARRMGDSENSGWGWEGLTAALRFGPNEVDLGSGMAL
jgi:hypothetical protein